MKNKNKAIAYSKFRFGNIKSWGINFFSLIKYIQIYNFYHYIYILSYIEHLLISLMYNFKKMFCLKKKKKKQNTWYILRYFQKIKTFFKIQHFLLQLRIRLKYLRLYKNKLRTYFKYRFKFLFSQHYCYRLININSGFIKFFFVSQKLFVIIPSILITKKKRKRLYFYKKPFSKKASKKFLLKINFLRFLLENLFFSFLNINSTIICLDAYNFYKKKPSLRQTYLNYMLFKSYIKKKDFYYYKLIYSCQVLNQFTDAKTVLSQIIERFRKMRSHSKAFFQIKNILVEFLNNFGIIGILLIFYGKFRGKTRTQKTKFRIGESIKTHDMISNVNYAFSHCSTFTGVFGCYLWLLTR
jgi:hypothetical protein